MLNVRVSVAGVRKIDELRGAWTRSEYVRHVLIEAMKAEVKGPSTTEGL